MKRKLIRKDLQRYIEAGFKVWVIKRCPKCGYEVDVKLAKSVKQKKPSYGRTGREIIGG